MMFVIQRQDNVWETWFVNRDSDFAMIQV